jgi:hypothetical protein
MYNIAKVAKGEILIYFNHIFDALCKVSIPACVLNRTKSHPPVPHLARRGLGAVRQERS